MKVNIVVTATIDLPAEDVRVLKRVSAGHVCDTIRHEKSLRATIESSPKQKTKREELDK